MNLEKLLNPRSIYRKQLYFHILGINWKLKMLDCTFTIQKNERKKKREKEKKNRKILGYKSNKTLQVCVYYKILLKDLKKTYINRVTCYELEDSLLLRCQFDLWIQRNTNQNPSRIPFRY